jgi:hypothetical protein
LIGRGQAKVCTHPAIFGLRLSSATLRNFIHAWTGMDSSAQGTLLGAKPQISSQTIIWKGWPFTLSSNEDGNTTIIPVHPYLLFMFQLHEGQKHLPKHVVVTSVLIFANLISKSIHHSSSVATITKKCLRLNVYN